MEISKEQKEKAKRDWYELLDIGGRLDMNNVREVFKDKITNDTGDNIDLNYKSICATFSAYYDGQWDDFGGRAVLSNNVEVYNDDGVFVDRFSIV